MRTIVFGAGEYGRHYIKNCPQGEEIVAVCDNNWSNLGGVFLVTKLLTPKRL